MLHADVSDVGTSHGFRGGRTGETIDYIHAPVSVRVLEPEIVYSEQGGRYLLITFLLLPGFVFLHFLVNDKETNPRRCIN